MTTQNPINVKDELYLVSTDFYSQLERLAARYNLRIYQYDQSFEALSKENFAFYFNFIISHKNNKMLTGHQISLLLKGHIETFIKSDNMCLQYIDFQVNYEKENIVMKIKFLYYI